MIWSRICWCTVGFSIGTKASTRPSRFRGIQSADEMNTVASGDGSPCPAPKQTILACSRNRPIMLFTVMFSESPATPGRSEHMPRMISDIDERVELSPDRRRSTRLGVRNLGLDQLEQSRPDPVRRNRQLFEVCRVSIASDEIEYSCCITAQRRIGGKV